MSLNDKASAALRRELAKCFPERAPDDAGHGRLADALTKPTQWDTDGCRYVGIRAENGSLNLIADLSHSCYRDRQQEHARLIAAAPDLLEACRMAANREGDWMAACDAAIAKAEGGAK